MPELPEVESVRRSLIPMVAGREIVRVEVHRRDVIIAPGDPPGGFSRQRSDVRRKPKRLNAADLLTGQTIRGVVRHGKQLVIQTDGHLGSRAMIIQLGMTGHVQVLCRGQKADGLSHVHVTWRLPDGRMVFDDARRFGGVRLFASAAALKEHLAALGPDALSIEGAELRAALAKADRPIKACLLDQAVLAGVGNIYADEALFLANIAPAQRASSLSPADVDRLAAQTRRVLEDAVLAGGSSIRDYADAQGNAGAYQLAHKVYGRAGEPCVICGSVLSAGVMAQRTTVWCPRCQPART